MKSRIIRRSLVAFLLTVGLITLLWPSGLLVFANVDGYPGALASSNFASTGRVNVAIQVGHWKESELPDALARLRGSTGTAGGGRTEISLNLDIAQRVATMLRSKGLTVQLLPATVPTGYQADMFIAIHADGVNSSTARGYKVSTRWSSEVSALDATLARSLDNAYGWVTGLPRDPSITRAMRGYYAYSTYRGEEYRLAGTTPAAIIEMGFMTNPSDRAVMFNKPNLVASGIVAGIEDFYSALPDARRLQAIAQQQAARSPFQRSAVALYDAVNIRADKTASSARVATANFGDSFPVLDPPPAHHPSNGTYNPSMGTTLASGSGWYSITLPDSTATGYISRDVVVVQQHQSNR